MATPEAKELSLVGKVELRIALADSDVKLETTLNTYLAPLLLKLASEHLSVRNKVISICQHINNRIKPQSIKLPVAALLKQFKEHPSTPLIRHFDLLYVQQGIGRLPIPERLELLPALIRGLESDTANSALHGSQLFHLLLRLLALFKLPARGSKEDEELRAKLNVSDVDAKFVSFWLGKLILLNIVRAPNPSSGVTCPGLSANEYHFLALQGNTDAWDPAKDNGLNLAETKVTAARFLASGVFTDAERFLPAVFASADSNSRISEVGDDMLKRALPNTDLENRTLITQLYSVYFGDPGGSLAARPALRIKLVSLFAKSLSSTTFPNQVIRIVEEALVSGEEDVGGTREISKLRSAIFAFINFVARHASPNDQHAIAPKVVYRLKDFIEVQGWPEGIGGDPTLRGYAYEVIGLLSKAGPTELLLEPNLDLLRWLFQSLREDTSGKNVTVSVEEALSSVLGAFTGSLDGTVEQSLKALLISQMLPGNGRSTSYVAVRFANRCLLYDALEARWIDLLAIGAAEGPEVIEEGRRGLDPYWYQMTSGYKHSTGFADSRVRFPKFVDFVDYVFIDHDPADATGLEGLEMASVSEAVHCLRMQYPKVFTPAVQHCRQLLMNEALDKHCIMLEINADWARKLDRTMSSDETARRAAGGFVRTMLSDPPKKKALSILLYALFQDLVVTGSVGHSDGGEHFVELCALCPDDLIAGVAPRFRSLESAITSNTYTTRAIAAHAYGLLASNPACSSEDVLQSAQLLLKKVGSWDRAVGSEVNQAHGALIALSFFFSRLAHRRRIEPDLQNVFQQCLTNVFSILTTAKDNLLKEASCTAIGQLSLYSALSVSDIPSNLSYDTVADKIYDVAKSGNEKAILALGHLAMTPKESEEDAEFSELYHIEALLHKLHEIRQTEAHFAVGEALSCLACGWDSKALATKFDIEGSHTFGPKRERTLPRIMDRTLNDCRDTKPALKKAAVIWLLCLLQFCGHHPKVQERLPNCQAAFKRCLSDRDDLIQETASRGLGLVYEKGDRTLKDDLVRDLVGSFSDNKAQLAGNVTEDTQLFEPGALPTGDGSITTYKDIMSLASEVGDSSLVYRFMSLASNNAIWSSRAAFGRFGLSNVLSDSSVDGYLAENPKLYPKLFRYRFDPNGAVQRSMNDIWNALVKDSSATINKYFDAIMEDLLQNILAEEWRVRQATCAAIADLVQGRALEQYEKYLERIWTLSFKVLDDIKESVRTAAGALARVMTSTLIRSLEAGESSSGNAGAMLKHVLPFLLSTSGLESSAKEVQAFALSTLLQIVKKSSGNTLRPFIPELVERLLGLLSSLEPQVVNYVHLNASKYNLTEQKIDEMRLASIRGSPLTESIERCLDLMDDATMTELRPRLEIAMKTAVGLPSKVGCSRILVSLSTRHSFLFRPHADYFLKLVEKHLLDRNETVSSSYAASAGYVARTASDKQIVQLANFAKRLYFTSEDDHHRIASGEMIYAISKYSTDRFSAFATDFLPFVFVAKHDGHEVVKEFYQNTWDENVAGPRTVLLYVKEIVDMAQAHLDSPRWVLKHTASRAIAEVVISIESTGSEISLSNAEVIWPALDKAMGGKTWEGKEIILKAFVRFVEKGGQLWRKRTAVADSITKIIVREARRQNAAYRQFAIRSIGQVASARTDVDMSDVIIEILSPVMEGLVSVDESAMDVDGGTEALKNDKVREQTLAAAIETLQDAINPKLLRASELSAKVLRVLDLIAKSETLQARSSVVELASFQALGKLFQKLKNSEGEAVRAMQAEMWAKCSSLLFGPTGSSEAIRLKRADAILALAELSQLFPTQSKLSTEIATEKSPAVRKVLEQALEVRLQKG